MSLLKLSLGGLGLLALSACFVACGDDDKGEETPDSGDTGGSTSSGGKTGSGGDTEAGSGGSGGSSSGGATEAGSGGSAGEGGPGPTDGGGDGAVGDGAVVGDGGGMSMAKFCNHVALGSGAGQTSVTFRLVIGEGATAVNLEAATGTCSPAVNLPCTMFASGTDVSVKLYDKTDLATVLEANLIDAVDGDTWIFGAEITGTGAEARPTVAAYDPAQGATCSSTDYADVYPPILNASSNVAKTSGYIPAR